MIISPGRRYIFVHAPKTGGTAMALALEARAMKDDIFAGDTPKAKARAGRLKQLGTRAKLSKHSMLAEVDGHLSPADLAGYFVFTMVRNPWDRLVSYYHWLQDQAFSHPAVTKASTLEFAAFLEDALIQDSFRHAPAARYVTNASGNERCDLFIRLEELQSDIKPLEAHLGFSLDLPRANQSRRDADYRSYYTATTRDIVADICAVDIARFDYRFD